MSGLAGQTGLPASFEMVWGLRDRPTKGPRPGLSLEQIVDAAVDVANVEGIGGVSMSRVAKELGASAMSLYRYVASKDELLSLMIDGAFGRIEWQPVEGTWRERLADWSRLELVGYRQFPWILHIPVSGPPIMPNQMRFMEQGLRALADTKLAEHEKLSTILLITSFTRSFAQLSSEIGQAQSADQDAADIIANFGTLIRQLTSKDDFPALHAVVDEGTFDDGADDLDYDYHFGLERVLDGIEALIRARE